MAGCNPALGNLRFGQDGDCDLVISRDYHVRRRGVHASGIRLQVDEEFCPFLRRHLFYFLCILCILFHFSDIFSY